VGQSAWTGNLINHSPRECLRKFTAAFAAWVERNLAG
jgi:hypothetical protein